MTPRSRSHTTVLALLTALGALTALTTRQPAHAAPGTCETSVPYVSGQGGYAVYRIPAVVRTRPGTLLAFAEGRRGGAQDSGDIDVVLRRSADGGCTWDPLTVVAAGHGDTRGNPAPVVDPRTGTVVLVTCGNSGGVTEARIMRGEVTPERGRRVYVQRSADDGRHFTAPRDITDAVKRPDWRWYATGPGHALALTRGPHTGRLLIPANHSAAPPAGSPDTGQEARYYGGHALYSDDVGHTWHLGFTDADYDGVTNANETSAAQLPDGRVYLAARDQNGTAPGNRLYGYSGDGGLTLDRPYAVQPALNAVPVVQGSVLQPDTPGAPLLFSAPSVPTARRALALWAGTDAGRGFLPLRTLTDRPSAYSDLVQLDARHIGVLYETGTDSPYETLQFRRVPLP
ncbi:sialidase family protein [Streptomyces achromogenes]|uniref:sialidase family protein n=1 Tax=Streptomyces achromogenes TaxID=67255 RepID=UPI003A805977